MSLQSRLLVLINAIGADIKALRADIASIRSNPPMPAIIDGGGP